MKILSSCLSFVPLANSSLNLCAVISNNSSNATLSQVVTGSMFSGASYLNSVSNSIYSIVGEAISSINASDNSFTTTLAEKTIEIIDLSVEAVQPAFNISVSEVFKTVVSTHVVQETLASPFLPIIVAGCVMGIGSVILEEVALNRSEKEVSQLAEKGKKTAENKIAPILHKRAILGGRSKGQSQKSRRQYHEKVNCSIAEKNFSRQKPIAVHQPVSKGRGNYGKKH